MIINKRYFYSLLLLLSALSCRKDFDTINKDPLHPTDVPIETLFNGVIGSLVLGWNEQFYLHNETLYDAAQQGALTSHAWPNTEIGTNEVWDNYYSTLRNVRELERRLDLLSSDDPDIANNAKAMLKILVAYKTFKITDLWGDIPFFDAGKGVEGVEQLRPEYDSQEAIYKYLLDDLKWAAEHIAPAPNAMTPAGNPYFSFKQFDTLLKNDLLRWQRWANAMRLKHAMRMSGKDPAFAGEHVRDIIENDLPLIRSTDEAICLWPRYMNLYFGGRHWSFYEHKNLRMGSAIWSALSESDAPDGSGIVDPRTRVFFEPNNAGEWRPFPNDPGSSPPAEGGIPYNGARDSNWGVKGSSCKHSPFNYYLIRDGEDVPEILQTAAEVHFLKSEAWKRGIGVEPDDFEALAEYEQGLLQSVKFWFHVMNTCQIWVNGRPPTPSDSEVYANFINHPKVNFAQNNFPLELIHTQRWLDLYRQPWEGFAVWRQSRLTPHEGDDDPFYRLAYPSSEREYNQTNWLEQVAKMGGEDANSVKVWWMD